MPRASLRAALQLHFALRHLQADHANTSNTKAPHSNQMQGNMPRGAEALSSARKTRSTSATWYMALSRTYIGIQQVLALLAGHMGQYVRPVGFMAGFPSNASCLC